MKDGDSTAPVAAGDGHDEVDDAQAPRFTPSLVPGHRGGTMPIPPRHFVPRPRLWQCLDQSTRMGVTVVTGPMGTGKTLGIAGWVRARGHDRHDAIWVHADAALTPRRLRAALARASQGEGASPDAHAGPRLMVIDDAQALPTASVRVIDELLRTAPDSMRLLLISRWDLPLTRLVPELLGHLTVLRGDLLRMTDDEAATLVAFHLGKPDPDIVRAVVEFAHGWSAVLVLAAHAVGRAPEPAAAVRRLAEGAAPVADQVASEVFATLSAPQRHLLLCLSGEDPFGARLAAHLSDDRHAAQILEELETTGLLVTRVPALTDHSDVGTFPPDYDTTESGARFLIHPLLQEVVRRRLAEDSDDVVRARATVTRAVRIDLANGRAPRSLQRLVRLYAFDEAAEVLARDGVHMMLGPGRGDEVAAVVRDHPELVDGHPSTWFAVALDRWLSDDPEGIQHWTGRIVARAAAEDLEENGKDALGSTGWPSPAQVACSHLWRGKLGLEPLELTIGRAQQVVADLAEQDEITGADAQAFPLLLMELGAAQGWSGALDAATTNFATAMVLCRSQGLSALSAAAMTHLAMSEFMAGHDRAAAEVATEAFNMLGEGGVWRLRFSPSRAGLALFLSSTVALPWSATPAAPPLGASWRRTHSSDLTARFWSRARDAILATWSGSVAAALAVLAAPVGDPRLRDDALPRHLRIALLVGESLLAAVAADPTALEHLESELRSMGAVGEARFVSGLRADGQGDRKAALEAFGDAAETATCPQPPVRTLGLACAAQLLDGIGEAERALDRLAEAAAQTQVRRNGVAFLGWSRQGSPMEGLLRRLDARGGTPWVHELAELAAGRSDVISSLESSTPLRLEQRDADDPLVGPSLSPREREVLGELARGATYADIGSTLFLSPNTVKTHVSSLYSKLGVSRRSDALAIARSHHIL